MQLTKLLKITPRSAPRAVPGVHTTHYPITVERSEIMRVEVTMDTQNTEPKKGHKKTQPKSGKPKGKCMHSTRGAEHPTPPGRARKQPLLAEHWRIDLSRARDTGGRVFSEKAS